MTADQRVGNLAAGQHGVISRAQALACGMTPDQIKGRVGSGRWRRSAHAGVYRLAGSPQTWQQRAMAAVLAGPADAVASHTTAAALLGLRPPEAELHVTVPPGASGRRHGVVAHRAHVGASDRCRAQRVPATRPARTLVDCAVVVSRVELMAIVDPCLCRRLTTPSAVVKAAARVSPRGNRAGLADLKAVLGVWTDGITPGSPAEMRLLRRIERWGLPAPERQLELFDGAGRFVARLDLGWRRWRAGLEYDGAAYHGPRQWEADAARQAAVEALGWTIERVEKVDLIDGAERLRWTLTRLLRLPT